MATYEATTFGNISGRHGTAVGAVVNGKGILKVYTCPTNPRTEKQQSNRRKFGAVVKGLKALRRIICIGYGNKAGYFSTFSWVLKNAVIGNDPEYTIDYSKIQLSSGGLQKSPGVKISDVTDNNVIINWDTSIWDDASANDHVNCVFLIVERGTAVNVKDAAIRSEGKIEIELPVLSSGETVHGWMYFSSEDGIRRSDSQYLDAITF